MNYASFEQVWANPYPILDQITPENPNASEQQFKIYQEILNILQPSLVNYTLDSTQSISEYITITSIPAGAGSGKTRTLVSIMIALLRLGESPNHIHSLSFTNASANDLRGKLISESIQFLRQKEDFSFQPSNFNCSTIHKHAIDMLKYLEPHVGGVGYYFEDASQSTPIVDDNANENEEVKSTKKSILLSLFASIYFHQKNNPYGRQLSDALRDFILQDSKLTDNRFIIHGLQNFDLMAESTKFITEESLSDSGLGAFTNIDNTDPNYAIAVATDALLRLSNAQDTFNQHDKYDVLGLPKYLMVDEAQDIDMIQALYLRALAINGTHIIFVGDPRQTLYAFRNALSEWIFEQKFLDALFIDTYVKPRITQYALTTNYRSRNEILQFAELISEKMVNYAQNECIEGAKYIDHIHDPKESVRRNESFKPSNADEAEDQQLNAINVIIGDISERNDWLTSQTNATKNIEPKLSSTIQKPIGLQRLQNQINKTKQNTTEEHSLYLELECKKFQLASKCGGKNKSQIEEVFHTLYQRCAQGDSVGILLRNNVTPEDQSFLKNMIQSLDKTAFTDDSVVISQTGNDRQAPIDNYYFLNNDNQLSYGVPFSSLMIAAAIHYFFSWDKDIKEKFQRLAKSKEINFIYPVQTLEQSKQKNILDLASIELELNPFFEALIIHRQKIFPNTAVAKLEENKDKLLKIFVQFIENVLHLYAVLLWQAENKPYGSHPCRFQGCVTRFDKGTGDRLVRHLSQSKRYFKLMWEAISKTSFVINQENRTLLKSLNIKNEWLAPSVNLVNFPQSIAELRDEFSNISQNDENFNQCLKQRERIHEQFSKFYHRKTRIYLRAMAKKIGYEVRYNMTDNVPEITILRAAYQYYMDARNEARTNTWFKGEGEHRRSFGLFNDMLDGIRDIDIQAKPRTMRNLADDKQIKRNEIIFSTIHSSKGLEWDHVVLVIPKPSTNDTTTSFKSARDLLYVAMTRAKKTLTILIDKEKNQRVAISDTCFKVANRLIHECTKELNWYNRKLAFTNHFSSENQKNEVKTQPIICIETTHSELEKTSTCQIHHYIQHNRTLSSMNPLANPSYAFFFHNALSSICAALSGQRINSSDDPVVEIADFIKDIAQRPNLNYQQLCDTLIENLQHHCNSVMQTMIPMYYLIGESRFVELIDYYSVNFLQQLASIVLGSNLFSNLLLASKLPNHRILIEKSIRGLEKIEHDDVYLPMYGVPDVAIIGDKINYIADYKTIFSQKNVNKTIASETMKQISQKTAQQIAFYQGILHPKMNVNNLISEVIYVADLTVQEYEEIPSISPKLPPFQDSTLFSVQIFDAAIVLMSQLFDVNQYQQTIKDIDTLRLNTEHYDKVIPVSLFEARPMHNLMVTANITSETCLTCASRIHCQQVKSEQA